MNMNKLILLAILMPTFFNVCAQKNVADSKNNNAMRYNQHALNFRFKNIAMSKIQKLTD